MIDKFKARITLLKSVRHPVRLLVAYFLRKSHLSRFFSIHKDFYALRFYPTALLMHLWADRTSRSGEELFLGRMVKCGSLVVDIGANVGTLALPLSVYVGESGHVYAIEAHPKIFFYLQKNIVFNGRNNITPINKAVGEKEGHLFFSNYSSDDQNHVVHDENGIKVEVVPLTKILQQEKNKNIRLIKIDVEGYELFVLKGAKELLKRTEIIYFESWEEHFQNYGYSTNDILKFLHEQGFTIYKTTGSCSLRQVDTNYISQECENLIAVQNEKILKEFHEEN